MKPLALNISLSSLILFLSLSSASAQTIIPQRPDQQAGARTQAAATTAFKSDWPIIDFASTANDD